MTGALESTSAVLSRFVAETARHVARFDAPVEPDSEEARRLLLDELSKPQYAAAQPTWFDILAGAVWDWLSNLTLDGPGVEFGLTTLLITVVAVLLIGALLIFGVPRMRRLSAVTGPLFGVDEHRSAAQLRASARSAANAHDWDTAIEEQFRAIARSLQERTVFTPTPGTTAQAFSRHATTAFPEHATALRHAATTFDDVRYLDAAGTEANFEQLIDLDRNLEATAPILSRRLERARA